MVYIPPSCESVNFFLRPIIIPICSSVNFSINSIGTDVGIVSRISKIKIYNETFYFIEGSFILPETSYINLNANTVPFTAMSDINSDVSSIKIISDLELIKILPDIITHDSIIKVNAKLSEIVAGLEHNLPSGIGTGGMISKWGGLKKLDESTLLNWIDAVKNDNFVSVAQEKFSNLNELNIGKWGNLDVFDNTNIIKYNDFNTFDVLSSLAWNSFIVVDDYRSIVYGNKQELSNSINVKYLEPGAKDAIKTVKYGDRNEISNSISFKWITPSITDKTQNVIWGPVDYYKFCTSQYYPNICGTVNFKLKRSNVLPGACLDVSFDVKGYNTDPRCPYKHHYTGRRDPYISTGIDVTPLMFPTKKESYYMLNTVLVKRLPDNLPIEVTSIDIKYDKSSWLWQFSLVIGKDKTRYLDLIKPNPDNANMFTDIEININGWKWTCRVEGWSESRVFSVDSWTITGRSPSMELSSPHNQKTSYTYDREGTSVTAGAQIIGDILEGTMIGIDDTGWSVDWSEYGPNIHTGFNPNDGAMWGIPANTFSWTNSTQIDAIKQLSESIGMFFMTKPDCYAALDKKLIAKPMFNIPPWHWNETSIHKPNIQHMIRSDYAAEIGRSYESLTTYTGVYVMGESSVQAQSPNTIPGIPVVEVFRTGFSDRIYAPDYVNPWITTSKAALEQGRMILCETGEWIRHSMRLFSLARPESIDPAINKLMIPGDYVKVNEKETLWTGEIDSVQVSAVAADSAFIVYQTVEISQYIGN